ncbi:MAG: tripartite tricarboxylate transporter substrate binding protein [Betaproteobacteria bacterium]|nr:tripartite tricarboxylate transporter substrate binding protein [Betaproteobacteria bacterium]
MKAGFGIRDMPALGAACLLAASAAAQTPPPGSATWPTRPVRIIVPFAPGGGVDTVTRFLAQKLTEQIGGSFVVENRPGGAGLLGAELVARAAPDGYTLLTSAPEFSINPSVRPKLAYDPFKDFAYISQLTSGQFMLASHPSVPVKTVKHLIALAKARPGQLNYGSSGAGGINHLAGELFQSMAGIRWVHVPFKGAGPATIGLMGGQIDFVFASTTGLVGPAKTGKVRPIAVTGPRRFMELRDVPTIAESGIPGYEVTGWYGFYAPGGTSADLIRRLHAEAGRALNSADVKEKLVRTGNEPVVSSPEEFVAFMRGEIAKWAKVVKQANIRVE